MSDVYTGGCACGAVRYRVSGEPAYMNHCQCRDCQHASGTGHGSYLTFASADVTLTGQAMQWDRVAGSGNVKTGSFCGRCGTPVYVKFSAMPQWLAIHAASLDEPGRFKPQAVTYHQCALAWDLVSPALTTFDKMPPA